MAKQAVNADEAASLANGLLRGAELIADLKDQGGIVAAPGDFPLYAFRPVGDGLHSSGQLRDIADEIDRLNDELFETQVRL